ncbi:MAG: DUF998 domain-containing protein [Hamadaea sp.]|uniref:DUF998 domain-containing protein n=1 Tax=Hamadaea sp. TaxID=2024425 RepID=UPI00185AAB2B|nr:DUF998 domain-containing protein [Hamadaea sp.]NUR74645.1 DUF998 domain-containing protein [Hamadaea sp.]NUT21145.1 DUF998 domain-containing protein [Hamadaea sp.]
MTRLSFALFGLLLSGLLTIVGHLDGDGLSPWEHTISDYAAADRGGAVETAMALAALATLGLLPSLYRSHRLATVLLSVWSGALLVATVVPTDPVGEALSAAGYLHRYASTVAFAALLAAGLRLGFRRLTGVGMAGGLAMLASTYLLHRYAIGLTERVMAAAELGMLIVLAGRLLRAAVPAPTAALARL